MIKLMIMTVERIKLEPDWLTASFSFPLLEQTAFFPDGQTLLKNQFIFFYKGWCPYSTWRGYWRYWWGGWRCQRQERLPQILRSSPANHDAHKRHHKHQDVHQEHHHYLEEIVIFRLHPIPSTTKNDFWTWSAALAVLDRLTWPCSAWLNWANLRKKHLSNLKQGLLQNQTQLV